MNKTPILGKAVATAEQMAGHLLATNPEPQINIPAISLARLFLYLGALEGVRGDLEFARSCWETNYFRFTGTVVPAQNNYCGHGTVSAEVKGASFPDEATGILVQMQHAKGYATTEPLNYDCLDDRYKWVKLGTAPNMEDMGGKWAVPGYDTDKYSSLEEANADQDSYGYKVVAILNEILTFGQEVEEDKQEEITGGNSPLVDYVKISPNSTNPRNKSIKKITIHHMAGDLTVEELGAAFADPARDGSSNYGIDNDGKVGMYVEECNRAWTSGSRDNDHQAVTIEVANDGGEPNWHVSDKAIAKLIDLCVDICKRNDIEKLIFTGDASGNLTMHKYFEPTRCPGEYLASKFPYIANEVNKRLGAVEEPEQDVSILYRVQVGAFSVPANADALKGRLEAAGFEAFVTTVGNLKKVQVGAFGVKANAETLRDKVKAAGFDAIIVEY